MNIHPSLMVDYDVLFQLEMTADPTERGFIYSLLENPKDFSIRSMYHDFLLERGRDLAAWLVKEKGYVPGAKIGIIGEISSEMIASGFSVGVTPLQPYYTTHPQYPYR